MKFETNNLIGIRDDIVEQMNNLVVIRNCLRNDDELRRRVEAVRANLNETLIRIERILGID